MDYKVVHTKPFNTYLRGLQQQGQKKVVQAVRAAITEAGMTGEIQALPRTKHGETRIPDVEKYDLYDGHRLVVQIRTGTRPNADVTIPPSNRFSLLQRRPGAVGIASSGRTRTYNLQKNIR